MAERLTPNTSEHESREHSKELERLAQKTEVIDEKIVESDKQKARNIEKESRVKLEQLEQDKKVEKESKEKETRPSAEKKPDKATKAQKSAAFKAEISEIQQHLSPVQRGFSKVVHNPAVESVSQVLEETIFRPSFLLGGSVGALIFGGGLYLTAKVRGYPIAGSEFLVGIIIGGSVGILVEFIRIKILNRDNK